MKKGIIYNLSPFNNETNMSSAEYIIVGDFMSCRWSDFITGQQVASFFVIDSFL